jgi:CelD/BcsL family acetyltransferase involved in cellulose biosynthesis
MAATLPPGRITTVALNNEDLIRRYRAGEPVDELAAAAEMTRSGMYRRLSRLGQPVRASNDALLDDQTVTQALNQHGSVNAAAKALGVPRAKLGAEAVRLGLRPRPASIPADLEAVYAQHQSIDRVAAHYNTSGVTIARWLRSIGVALHPGRKPRDG